MEGEGFINGLAAAYCIKPFLEMKLKSAPPKEWGRLEVDGLFTSSILEFAIYGDPKYGLTRKKYSSKKEPKYAHLYQSHWTTGIKNTVQKFRPKAHRANEMDDDVDLEYSRERRLSQEIGEHEKPIKALNGGSLKVSGETLKFLTYEIPRLYGNLGDLGVSPSKRLEMLEFLLSTGLQNNSISSSRHSYWIQTKKAIDSDEKSRQWYASGAPHIWDWGLDNPISRANLIKGEYGDLWPSGSATNLLRELRSEKHPPIKRTELDYAYGGYSYIYIKAVDECLKRHNSLKSGIPQITPRFPGPRLVKGSEKYEWSYIYSFSPAVLKPVSDSEAHAQPSKRRLFLLL